MKIEHRRIHADSYDTRAFAERMPARLLNDLTRGDAPGAGEISPALVLRRMIEGADEAFALSFDGVDVALYGVRLDSAGNAFVCVVEAEGFDAGNKLPFMRILRRTVEEWGRRYKMLYGIIHKEFPEFIRYLKYIGFVSQTFVDDENYAVVVKTWE